MNPISIVECHKYIWETDKVMLKIIYPFSTVSIKANNFGKESSWLDWLEYANGTLFKGHERMKNKVGTGEICFQNDVKTEEFICQ